MPEFFNVLPPDDAKSLLLSHITRPLAAETAVSAQALGRITAQAVHAPHPLPAFRRSSMDGFAVQAASTFGATDSLPAFLQVVGEVPMGQPAITPVGVGQAVIVHTGGMIPDSADAVVQVEHTQRVGAETAVPYEIEVIRAVGVGQNVIQQGEDVRQNAPVLPAGHRLRPQDIGGLLALGIVQVDVIRQPRVGILSTGDEVIPPEQATTPGQIRDINSYTIASLVTQAGGIPVLGGIVPDQMVALQTAVSDLLPRCDMVVITAGSSVSVRDMTAEVIQGLGKPGVLLHGVATRPGKPTIVGMVGQKPVLGLPGNPVSAIIQFDMFGTLALDALQGAGQGVRHRYVSAILTQNVPSESGREDYVPARLTETAVGWQATPLFGKSNLIYTLVNADGLIKVPLNRGGLYADERVDVRLF